MIYGLT